LIDNQGGAFHPNTAIDRHEFRHWLENVLGTLLEDKTPNKSGINRAEVAAWVDANLPPMNTGVIGDALPYPFTDTEDMTTDEQGTLDHLYKLGIMVGDGQGHFMPDKVLTRGEAAVLMQNILYRSMQGAKLVPFEVVASDARPEAVQAALEEHATEPGVQAITVDGARYLLITGNRQPSTGYDLQVAVRENAIGIFVLTQVTPPREGTETVPNETFPTAVVKIKASTQPVYLLPAEEDSATVPTGKKE
ncbi:MAG TPA: S-layer homology domain-containing protein, partial [Bacilli bacterium]|nr:S-layer homology domain-containing protein [Bacilli bacterium]